MMLLEDVQTRTDEKIAIEKIKHFISKDALNIDGLGKRKILGVKFDKKTSRYI